MTVPHLLVHDEDVYKRQRKYNVGVLFAHQHLDQLTPALRASVAANTSIKLAGGISDKDARALAADMRTTPDFLAGMAKHTKSTDFACYVRNYTANAVRLTVPFGTLEAAARMSAADHPRLIAANREGYATARVQPRPAANEPEQSPPSAAPPATAETVVSDDWRS